MPSRTRSGGERQTWGVLGQFPSQISEHQAGFIMGRIALCGPCLIANAPSRGLASITWDCSQSFWIAVQPPCAPSIPFRPRVSSRYPYCKYISDALEQKKLAPLFFEAAFFFVTMRNRTEVECVFGTQTES